MQSVLPEENSQSNGPAPSDRLDSWKEIAVYFRRDVRTVRRWEQSLGLPVHRHRHKRGVSVYAYKTEVDAWWERRDGMAAEAAAEPPPARRTAAQLSWVVVALLTTLGLLHSSVWRSHSPEGPPESGSGAVSHTGYRGIEEYPSLSPDAQQWAFSWNGGERRNFDIYIRALDRKRAEPVRLTRDAAADFKPTWSPDGRSIAFVRQAVLSQFQVMVIPAAGGQERSVATCQAEWDRRAGSYLAWTPDGRGLMMLQRESHGQTAGLLLVPPKKGRARRLILPLDGSQTPGTELAVGPMSCFATEDSGAAR